MKKYIFLLVLGLLMLTGGIALLLLLQNPAGLLRALPFVLVGLGCGLAGGAAGEMGRVRARAKNPKLAKQMDVEQADERNIALSQAAKAKVFDMMLYAFAALILGFALFGVEAMVVLALVAVYLAALVGYVVLLAKYQKNH